MNASTVVGTTLIGAGIGALSMLGMIPRPPTEFQQQLAHHMRQGKKNMIIDADGLIDGHEPVMTPLVPSDQKPVEIVLVKEVVDAVVQATEGTVIHNHRPEVVERHRKEAEAPAPKFVATDAHGAMGVVNRVTPADELGGPDAERDPSINELNQIATATPVVRVYNGDSAEEAFSTLYHELVDMGRAQAFDPSWGLSKKGYRGLCKSNGVAAMRCSYNEVDDSRLIYHTGKDGKTVVIYEDDGRILYSAHVAVDVNFDSHFLTTKDVLSFRENTYRD